MRRIILMLLVITGGCGKQNPTWVELTPSENIGLDFAVYTNSSTVHKNGDVATFWQIWDYKTPQESFSEHIDFEGAITRYSSVKRQVEYDCAKKQERTIYSIYFSENMGEGRVVYLSPSDGNEFLTFNVFGSMRSYELSKSNLYVLEKNPNVRLSKFHYSFNNSAASTPIKVVPNSLGEKMWRDACKN